MIAIRAPMHKNITRKIPLSLSLSPSPCWCSSHGCYDEETKLSKRAALQDSLIDVMVSVQYFLQVLIDPERWHKSTWQSVFFILEIKVMEDQTTRVENVAIRINPIPDWGSKYLTVLKEK